MKTTTFEFDDREYIADMVTYSNGEGTATASFYVHRSTTLSDAGMKKLHRIMKTQLFGYCKGIREVDVEIRWDDTFYVNDRKDVIYSYNEDDEYIIIGSLK